MALMVFRASGRRSQCRESCWMIEDVPTPAAQSFRMKNCRSFDFLWQIQATSIPVYSGYCSDRLRLFLCISCAIILFLTGFRRLAPPVISCLVNMNPVSCLSLYNCHSSLSCWSLVHQVSDFVWSPHLAWITYINTGVYMLQYYII